MLMTCLGLRVLASRRMSHCTYVDVGRTATLVPYLPNPFDRRPIRGVHAHSRRVQTCLHFAHDSSTTLSTQHTSDSVMYLSGSSQV